MALEITDTCVNSICAKENVQLLQSRLGEDCFEIDEDFVLNAMAIIWRNDVSLFEGFLGCCFKFFIINKLLFLFAALIFCVSSQPNIFYSIYK